MMPPRSSAQVIVTLTVVLLLSVIFAMSCSAPITPTQITDVSIQGSLAAKNAQTTVTQAALAANNTQATLISAQATSNHESNTSATAIAAVTATAGKALTEEGVPEGWKLTLYDPFDNNDTNWQGGSNNESAQIDRTFPNSNYEWTATWQSNFYAFAYPLGISNPNEFHVSVDGKLLSGEQSTSYGLIFRHYGKYLYSFYVNEQGYWEASFRTGNFWDVMIKGRLTNPSKDGYHLAVKGMEQQYIFYIDGEEVARKKDQRLDPTGYIGVIIVETVGGGSATVAFDNFTVLSP